MESRINILFKYRWLWHLLFWMTFLLYEVLIWGSVDGNYWQRFVGALVELPVRLAATYFTLYVLIDQFLLKKHYGIFFALLGVSIIFFGGFIRIIDYHTIYPWFYPESMKVPQFFIPKILIGIFAIYSVLSLAATIHLLKHWYLHQQATQQLHETARQMEKEKLEADLKLLRSQIHPHFLFNTLNNLYTLTLQQSEKAPDIVFKLSGLMSYMLYESNQPWVPIEREIQYIENYISLEKIRYGDRLDLSLNVYNTLEGIDIAPLLLLPFVENSFKHGISNQLDHVWVRIDIIVKDHVLIIKVENSKAGNNTSASTSYQSGIGLQNVKKRLGLIYQDQYNLQLFDEEDTYLVVLKINLSATGVPMPEKALQNKILLFQS